MGNQKEGKPQTSPIHQLEAEKREHKNKMKRMEAEMEQVFELKVKEKINRLNDSELGNLTIKIFDEFHLNFQKKYFFLLY